jgi:hypothetical protein
MKLDMGFDKADILFGIRILADDKADTLRSLESLIKMQLSNKMPISQDMYRKIMKALGEQLIYESTNPKFFGMSPDSSKQSVLKKVEKDGKK